jgi:arylesterase/paraoxonase
MKAGKRIAIVTGVVAVIGITALVARTLVMGGAFTEVKPEPLKCEALAGATGVEDIAIDRKDGLVFLSATDRRAPPGKPSKQDGLYAMSLRDRYTVAGRSAVRVSAGMIAKLSGTPTDFHPHGISLYRAPDGSLTLMAVNHRGTDHKTSVAIFQVIVSNGDSRFVGLNEIGDIESDKIKHANDVAAVSKEQFYITNDHGSATELGMTLENYLMLPRADVVYFDGSVFKEVANGLVFANGIAVSHDGKHVYVAESTARRIRSFERDLFSGRLTQEKSFEMNSGPDNIDVAENGELWVAAHPKMFALVDYFKDRSKPSPSEIYHLAMKDGIPNSAIRVYADLGHEIGAASVGAAADGKLFIGSIFDPKVLECRLP